MCWVRHLYRYLQFWWRAPTYWGSLITETKESFMLLSGALPLLYFYIIFIDSDSNFAKFLHVFLFLDIIVFLVLLRGWAKSKGRILFPKMTRLHGRETQRLGFGWEEPDDPENPVLPPMFGPVIRLPQPGVQMPGFQRPPNQPPFVPPALEYRHIHEIYRRSRLTDRPNLPHESLFSHTSNLQSTRETTFNPPSLLSSFPEQENLYQSSRTSRQQRYSLTDTNMPQVNIAGGQNIRVEVYAPTEYSSQQIRSPYDLINFGASTSRDTSENYVSATRAQAVSLEASYLETDNSDDSSSELPKPISYKTSEKDGENVSDESSFGKTGSNVSLSQSDESPSESSIEHESDSRSHIRYSPEKLFPLSVVELDAAGEMYEIPDSSETISRKQSISSLNQSSLEMHERSQFEKAAKDESVSETSFSEIRESKKREQFNTAKTSKFKASIPKKKTILHSSKKSSNLVSDSEQPFLHKTLQRTGKAKKICSISGKTEESPEKPETTSMGEKTEEISSTPEKDIEISRTHKPKHVSSTREKTKITSCTPEITKRTTTQVKRKTEASSEDEGVSISKAEKIRKEKRKKPPKIAKIEEASESDNSD